MPPKPRRRSSAAHVTAFQQQGIDWASPVQQQAFVAGPAPICCSGGFGAAKSFALCLKALYLSDLFPQNRGVIARKTWTTLKDTTMKTFFKLCPPEAYAEAGGGRRADSEKILRLAGSGSEIIWLHLDDDDIDKVIRGLEINWFFIDQAEEVSEEVFTNLVTRLGRWDQAKVTERAFRELHTPAHEWPWRNPAGGLIVPTYAMLACNPDAETHWIWRRFHEDSPDWQATYKAAGYRMFHMRSDDNKFLPAQNVAEMDKMDATWQRRFRYGLWGIPEGQIHDIRPESIVNGEPLLVRDLIRKGSLFRTMDYGESAPTAVGWWIVDENANVFLIAEYYKENLVISRHRRNIKELEGALKRLAELPELRYLGQWADPSIFNPRQSQNRMVYVKDDWADKNPDHGFASDDAIYWEKGDNEEIGTRNIINEYLKPQGMNRRFAFPPGSPEAEDIARHLGAEDAQRFAETHEEPRLHPLTRKMGYWPRLFFLKQTPEWPYGVTRAILETRSQRREKVGTDLGRPVFTDDRDESIVDHAYDMVRYFMASRSAKPRKPMQKPSRNSFAGVAEAIKKREQFLRHRRSSYA